MILGIIFNNLQLNLSLDGAINVLSGYGDQGPYQAYFKCNYNNGGSFVASTTIQYASDNNEAVYVGETLSSMTMTVIISGNSQTVMLPVASFDASNLTLDTTPTITAYEGGNDKNIKYLIATSPQNLSSATYKNGFFLDGLDTDYNIMPASQEVRSRNVPSQFRGNTYKYMTLLVVQNYTAWLLVGAIDSLPVSSTTMLLPASITGISVLMDTSLYGFINDNSDLFVPDSLGIHPLSTINPNSNTGLDNPYSFGPIDGISSSSSSSSGTVTSSGGSVSTQPLNQPIDGSRLKNAYNSAVASASSSSDSSSSNHMLLIIVMIFIAFIIFVIAVVTIVVLYKKYHH
jgi:hypothetical protein